MDIEHKTHPVEHWIVDGKAYRLATEADVGNEVCKSDTSFDIAIKRNHMRLERYDTGAEYPFVTGCRWKFAYVQDDSLLTPQRVPVPVIDWTKPVRTKDGRAVRVLCTDGPRTDYPVIGIIDGACEVLTWAITGVHSIGYTADHDLENIPPEPKRIKIERWANVYDEDEFYWWASRETADKCAKANRFACVKIVIDCVEGEGL